MLQVSDAYKELVKSNIRPKCEPTIKISGIDNNGNEIELVWNAKNIKDLKYKRGIDPVGRELPYMELTWTEIYTGKFSVENYPEKYNNVAKYMAVELSFIQDLGFYNTWKTIFGGRIKWSDLFSRTWKRVRNQVPQEKITMPKMFLEARPTIKGKTITWTARDLFYFLNEKQEARFEGAMPFENPLRYMLLNSRGAFLNSKDVFDSLTVTDRLLINIPFLPLDAENIIFDGSTKDLLINYAKLRNAYWDFKYTYATLQSIYSLNDDFAEFLFDKKTLFSYPEISKISDVSQYSFKRYAIYRDSDATFDKEYDEPTILELTSGLETQWISLYRYFFDEYGEIEQGSGGFGALKYAIASVGNPLKVIPIKRVAYDEYIHNNNVGEAFVEDNPVNVYGSTDERAKDRATALSFYFNSNKTNMEFECLPNLALTTGDKIAVLTGIFVDENEQLFAQGNIISIEINYNGALKQKIIIHEG